MAIWYTWLGYFGLIVGVATSVVFGTSLLRSGAIGLAAGIALVIVVNFVDPTPVSCLQNSKGWDILRAYSLDCSAKQ